MGKKRRAIRRVRKFATKYFKWLDKIDGTSDGELAKSLPIIELVTVTDHSNESATIAGRVTGGKGLNDATDTIKYSLDGGAIQTLQTGLTDAGNTPGVEGRYTFSAKIGEDGTGIGKGKHTIKVMYKDVTAQSRSQTVDFTLVENRINILATAFAPQGGNQIRLTKGSLLDDPPGKKKAGSGGDAENGNFGINITVKKGSDDVALAGVFADNVVTKLELGNLAGTFDILDNPAEGTYTLTVTPTDENANALTESAITFDVIVE